MGVATGSSKGLKQRGRHSPFLLENLKCSSSLLELPSNKALVMLGFGGIHSGDKAIRLGDQEPSKESGSVKEWLELKVASLRNYSERSLGKK